MGFTDVIIIALVLYDSHKLLQAIMDNLETESEQKALGYCMRILKSVNPGATVVMVQNSGGTVEILRRHAITHRFGLQGNVLGVS